MAASGQYDGFSDIGKALKSTALVSAIATLVLPLGTAGTFIVMAFSLSYASSFLSYDPSTFLLQVRGAQITAWCVVGGLGLLFYLASLTYRIRAFKALKEVGERQSNADITALGKHWFVELVMTVITGPLYAVTGVVTLVISLSTGIFPIWHPVLMLCNWFAMVLTGMYSMVDGFKKWEVVGKVLTSYKGIAGMQYMRNSQGVGFAIFIISHYAMVYLLVVITTFGMTPSSMPFYSIVSSMTGILFPVGAAIAIMTLVACVNYVKGLFRVGNAMIDLEEGRVASPIYGVQQVYRPQALPYDVQGTYGGPSYVPPVSGGGYQHGTWSAPRYSQALQPMQPVEPAPAAPAGYRDTSPLEAGWNVGSTAVPKPSPVGRSRSCTNCKAALPPNEDVSFCPYCGSPVQ